MQDIDQERFEKLEWMLDETAPLSDNEKDEYISPYGDVTKLNSCRLIMDSVGVETLKEIGKNAIKLLDTSVAIYEANGDYAFGMFSSGWCRLMDFASRELCKTDDNQEALSCGKWLCHENCWNDSAKRVIETGRSTDIECVGGIHLYAEPIYAGKRVIGTINIGYGDPPKDPDQRKALADAFGVDPEKLKEIGESYKSRPKFIVDATKKLLAAFAKLIGEIVEKAEAERKQKEAQNMLSRAEEIAHTGSWKLDMPANRLTWSDEVYRIFGCKPLEFAATYEAFLDFVHPNDRAAVDEAYSRSVQEGSDGYEIDHRIVRRNSGEVRHVHERCVHDRDDAGAIIKSIGMVQDITEGKQAEEALRESKEKFHSIFTSMTEIVVLHELVCDEDGRPVNYRILDCNPAFTRITGIRREDAVGRLATDVYDSESAPYLDEYARVALTGEPSAFITAHAPTDKHFDIHAASPGNKMFVTVTTDITERKQAEAEQEKLRAQLTQAQKMESVGRLAGGVAHDFNNMLSVILGNTEMVMEGIAPDDPLQEILGEISSAAKRSADTTRQLLAFARKQTAAPRVVDLNDTIESMLKMLRRLIGEDIDLTWLPGANIRQVRMDPSQIHQILANLCVNARAAIADVGKITIETGNTTFDSAYCAEHPGFVAGDFVLLAVSDDGCGMDPGALANLFEPFFTTKDVGKGIGLGLATVYGIVKQNDGFINVYSEPDQGTTFRIYLPRYLAETESPEKKTSDKITLDGTETILLVEDEPSILKMTRIMLERMGYKVLAAGRPGEAISLAREHAGKIHMLMTDVVMPEMNGRDLAKKILSLYPHLKCLFMSGYTANVITKHGGLNEGEHFIQKPFSVNDLRTKLSEALQH